jgi:hypothetical protein
MAAAVAAAQKVAAQPQVRQVQAAAVLAVFIHQQMAEMVSQHQAAAAVLAAVKQILAMAVLG